MGYNNVVNGRFQRRRTKPKLFRRKTDYLNISAHKLDIYRRGALLGYFKTCSSPDKLCDKCNKASCCKVFQFEMEKIGWILEQLKILVSIPSVYKDDLRALNETVTLNVGKKKHIGLE